MESAIDTIVFCIMVGCAILFMGLCTVGVASLFWKFYYEANKDGDDNIEEKNKYDNDVSKRK